MSLNREQERMNGNELTKAYSFGRRLGRRIEGAVIVKFDEQVKVDHEKLSSTEFDGRGFIVGGDSYSKMASLYTDIDGEYYKNIKVVLATVFEEEHRNMLIGKGILPMVFSNKRDLKLFCKKDELLIDDLELDGENFIYINNKNISVKVELVASQEEKEILKKYA